MTLDFNFRLMLSSSEEHSCNNIDHNAGGVILVSNEVLRLLCDDNEVEFVENYKSFLVATGELPLAFFHKDKLHINNAGTRKLLANIDKFHRVTRASAAPSQQHYKYQKRSGYQAFPNNKSHHPAAKFCHICSRTGNHNTQECWYNGRNGGLTYSGIVRGLRAECDREHMGA